jgi:hypothetical protein
MTPIMQRDLYANPNARSRSAFPVVVVLQADTTKGDTRLIAPLAPHVRPLARTASRALALIDHDQKHYAVTLSLISSLPRRQLRDAVGSLAAHRDDITRALDGLFFGI